MINDGCLQILHGGLAPTSNSHHASYAHPNIVTVYEAGIVAPHGVPFLAMELCPGEPLRARIDAQGAMAWPDVDTLVEQLGEDLDAAHAAGVVHRDLNPSNIMVYQDHKGRSRLKLLDFGIARFMEDSRSRTATTGENSVNS